MWPEAVNAEILNRTRKEVVGVSARQDSHVSSYPKEEREKNVRVGGWEEG